MSMMNNYIWKDNATPYQLSTPAPDIYSNMSIADALANTTGTTVAPSITATNINVPYRVADGSLPVPVLTGTSNTVGGYFDNTIAGAKQDWVGLKNFLGNRADNVQAFGKSMGNAWNNLNGLQKMQTVGGVLNGLYNAYSVGKQLKLAKDNLNFQKDQYYTNLNNQRKMVNSQLSDRQARREATANVNGVKTTSVKDYMDKYGV